MARITYQDTTTGGKMVSEAINAAIELKASVARLMAAINEATGGGATPAAIEIGGAFGTFFGVNAGSGQAFYTAFHDSVFLPITALVDNALADLDNGG